MIFTPVSRRENEDKPHRASRQAVSGQGLNPGTPNKRECQPIMCLVICLKFQSIFFFSFGPDSATNRAMECNESQFSLFKEDKYAACVLYSLRMSSRTWIGNHDSHLATSVTYSMFIFRPVNTHCLFTRILGSHMLTNDNIDILVARIKTRQAMYV